MGKERTSGFDVLRTIDISEIVILISAWDFCLYPLSKILRFPIGRTS